MQVTCFKDIFCFECSAASHRCVCLRYILNINNAANGQGEMLVSARSLTFLILVIREERKAEAAGCVAVALLPRL